MIARTQLQGPIATKPPCLKERESTANRTTEDTTRTERALEREKYPGGMTRVRVAYNPDSDQIKPFGISFVAGARSRLGRKTDPNLEAAGVYHVCMYVCMYACVYIYIDTYIYI